MDGGRQPRDAHAALRAISLLAVGGLVCLGAGVAAIADGDAWPSWAAAVLLPLAATMLAGAAAVARRRPRAAGGIEVDATPQARRGERVEATVVVRRPGAGPIRAGLVCRGPGDVTVHEQWRDLHPRATEHALAFTVPADAPLPAGATADEPRWEVVVEAAGARRATAAVRVVP